MIEFNAEAYEGNSPCRCGNCGSTHRLAELNPIQHPEQRIDIGGTVPGGECPDCGALAYVEHKPGAALPADVVATLRTATAAIDQLQHQIDQMRGMFTDEDGTIQDAADSGDEAAAEIRSVLARYAGP